MKAPLATPAFSPRMISLFHSWSWVRDDFAGEFARLSDAGAFNPDGGISETIWSTRSKFVLKTATNLGFDIAYKSFFQVKNSYQFLLRPSPCASEAANYVRLTQLGMPLPELLAVGERRLGVILKNAFMATRFIGGFRNGLDFYDKGMYIDNIPLIKEFCRGHLALLAKLHDAGIAHRGFTPSNLLYRQESGGMKLCWVDVAECRTDDLTVETIADDMIKLFRYLRIPASVRRELESDYLNAASVRRTDADQLFEVLEKRLVKRIKPYAIVE